MAPIAGFVQSERGLEWKHPVKVVFLPPAEFARTVTAEQGNDSNTGAASQQVLEAMRAIGVVSGTLNLSVVSNKMAQDDIDGQYVEQDKTVYVRGTDLTPYVRMVLAHELTHALQDQYFEIEKMTAGHADDDSAVTALIEGDAVRAQDAYAQSLSPAGQQQLAKEQQQFTGQANTSDSGAGVPAFLIDQEEFPYDFGPTFLAALEQEGGNAKVNAAFRHPPTLDGQIVNPAKFVPGAPVPKVALPALPAGARTVLPAGGFGQVTLLEMLGDEVGFNSAWPAVQGWADDKFVAYQYHGRVCVDLNVLEGSPAGASSLASVGRVWASRLPGASVAQAGRNVGFRSCDPGAKWKPAVRQPDPYQALATRALFIYSFVQDHVPAEAAACATDQTLQMVGAQRLVEVAQMPGTPQNESSSVVAEVRAAFRIALSLCGGTAK